MEVTSPTPSKILENAQDIDESAIGKHKEKDEERSVAKTNFVIDRYFLYVLFNLFPTFHWILTKVPFKNIFCLLPYSIFRGEVTWELESKNSKEWFRINEGTVEELMHNEDNIIKKKSWDE